jgi:hypothetical protein
LTRTPSLASAENAGQATVIGSSSQGDRPLTDILPFDQLSEQAGVGVVAGLAEKESVTSTAAPTPIPGALVQLEWDSSAIDVCEINPQDPDGTYGASSIPSADCGDDTLAYAEGSEYTTTFETGSDLYSITVTAPPAIDAGNVAFSPAMTSAGVYGITGLKQHDGGDLLVDWSADPSANDRHAFLTLVRINFSGTDPLADNAWTPDANNPVYDNAPREPGAMIDLVLNEPVTHVTIPASAFSEEGIYLLILTPAELSTSVSSNLALGSGALAGAGTAWMFWASPQI